MGGRSTVSSLHVLAVVRFGTEEEEQGQPGLGGGLDALVGCQAGLVQAGFGVLLFFSFLLHFFSVFFVKKN